MVNSDISTELCFLPSCNTHVGGGGTAADLEPILRSFLYQNGLKSNVSPRLMCTLAKAWVTASSSCVNPPNRLYVGQGRDTPVRDASSKARFIHGMHHPRNASSKGRIVQETHWCCPLMLSTVLSSGAHSSCGCVQSCPTTAFGY